MTAVLAMHSPRRSTLMFNRMLFFAVLVHLSDCRLDLRTFGSRRLAFAFSPRSPSRERCRPTVWDKLLSSLNRPLTSTFVAGRCPVYAEEDQQGGRGTGWDKELESSTAWSGSHGKRLLEANVDSFIMSFPYCSQMSVAGCRRLHEHLETLLREGNDKKSRRGRALISVGNSRRRKRSTGFSTAPRWLDFSRSSRTGSAESAAELLSRYRQWREEHGYGQQSARWGRSVQLRTKPRHHNSGATTESQESRVETGPDNNVGPKDGTLASTASEDKNSTSLFDKTEKSVEQEDKSTAVTSRGIQNDEQGETAATTDSQSGSRSQSRSRKKRAVVVQIAWPTEEQMSREQRDMLDAYLLWREQYGYGRGFARWGR